MMMELFLLLGKTSRLQLGLRLTRVPVSVPQQVHGCLVLFLNRCSGGKFWDSRNFTMNISNVAKPKINIFPLTVKIYNL